MSNYSRGANFERRVQKYFENAGYFVLRSAGSHSPVDLVTLKGGEISLIQCKTDGVLSSLERLQLEELAKETECQVFLISRQGTRMISEEIKEGK
jgi:Holliday junction resolvase